jgi:hypothetical protein
MVFSGLQSQCASYAIVLIIVAHEVYGEIDLPLEASKPRPIGLLPKSARSSLPTPHNRGNCTKAFRFHILGSVLIQKDS